ncbi:MAG TPA: hypothetical protein VGB42_00670 [Candidatus Thermoplasmatota archaeon]
MVDYDTANARLTALATFMGGLSFIGLILSINILTGKPREMTAALLVAESVLVIFLLVAIVLFLTSAVTLASAYFEGGVSKEVGMRRARRMNVSGTMLTFWAVAALLLVAFDFTGQAVLYAAAAMAAPLVFVLARRLQGIPL